MASPIRDQPHPCCATKTNAVSFEGLAEEIHESPPSSHSTDHIFNILHLLNVSTENDVLHLSSVGQRQSAAVKEDFVSSDGFRRIQSTGKCCVKSLLDSIHDYCLISGITT